MVLRRGWRSEVKNDVAISPHFYQQLVPDDPEEEWTPNKDKRIAREHKFFHPLSEDELELQPETKSPHRQHLSEFLIDHKASRCHCVGAKEKTESSELSQTMSSAVRTWPVIPNAVEDAAVRYPEHLSEIKHVDWSLLDPTGLKDTRWIRVGLVQIVYILLLGGRLASQHWSRIIRHPRKRTGHIILDVCSSCPSKEAGHCGGKLQRHVGFSDLKALHHFCNVDYCTF